MPIILKNFAENHWVAASAQRVPLLSAITGETVAETGSLGLDFGAMVRYSRNKGGGPRSAR